MERAHRRPFYRRPGTAVPAEGHIRHCMKRISRSTALGCGAWSLGLGALLLCTSLPAQTLDLPPRPDSALSGTDFARRISPLDLTEREKEIVAQVTAGNVPNFLRKLCPVPATSVSEGATNTATFYATPDYLAIGSDDDYFLIPVSPNTGQRIAR